ncbi:MAG: ABC transporter ATP-binding protein [Anaerolineae bacterium]|nr:ABC transporter ATP-binding protein [Anaerolineae bacterium]MCX8067907.1 ABC transporter ATP-binding protein [Anaerolineae bacterium]MDW7991332.1 ABC transporter ATP-binding protein [Anaerolineae bacterium]
MPLLKIENLHTFYGHVHALKGINLEVEEGEIVTLIGANGAGKSTTLRTISGLVRPREGRIEFNGHLLNNVPAHQIVQMGISHVPEGRRIFTTLTVMENLMMGAYTIRDERVIQENLERVFTLFPRLAERKNQLGGTLSGGEQQMLTIGRALMARPRLLLLDEPSLGLAPMLVRAIFETIREINAGGTTILLVEQNARAALKIAHRAYVLETGRVVLSGPAHELMQDERVRKAYLGER